MVLAIELALFALSSGMSAYTSAFMLGVWSHGIVVHCITISGGTNYGANSSRQRHND